MHIVNSMAANFGKYDLDVSAVGMRSISETDIKLPYTGVLPVQMSASSGAYVYLNIQLAQGARLVLVAHGKGKDIKRPLEASSEEIIALLDEFFKQNQDATGLAQYWLGVWQAHYSAIQIGEAAEARIQIGKRIFWNVEKIKSYINSISV